MDPDRSPISVSPNSRAAASGDFRGSGKSMTQQQPLPLLLILRQNGKLLTVSRRKDGPPSPQITPTRGWNQAAAAVNLYGQPERQTTRQPKPKTRKKRVTEGTASFVVSSTKRPKSNSTGSVDVPRNMKLVRDYLLKPKIIGSGSYSTVKRGVSVKTHMNVAVKIIDRKKAPNDFQEKFLPRELAFFRCLKHKHVIQLYDTFEEDRKVYIVMQLAQDDVLAYLKKSGGCVSETLARQWTYEASCGLDYLHSRNIVHRDVKCENLLLDSILCVKIADFGFARQIAIDELSSTFCGSAAYASPEILQCAPYSPTKSDVWALGVVIFVMTTGRMPYGQNASGLYQIIRKGKQRRENDEGVNSLTRISFTPTFPPYRCLSEACKQLICNLMNPNPETRFSIKNVLDSDWFKSEILY